MNVSGIVVKTTPEHLQEVITAVNAVNCCEVHFNDTEGRIVATIEGESIEDQMEKMKIIQAIPYVFSASLSYSYCEEEIAPALSRINENRQPLFEH